MTQKFQSGCKTPLGSTVKSKLGVRGCGKPLLSGTAISYDVTPEIQTPFIFRYGPASTIIKEVIKNLGFGNETFDAGESSVKQFAEYNDQIYAVGDGSLTRPDSALNGYIDRIMKFDKDLDDWIALVPEFVFTYLFRSIAFNAIDDTLVVAGLFNKLNNGGPGLDVDETKNIGQYNGEEYSTVSLSSPLVAFPNFSSSVQLIAFQGTVVAGSFTLAAFKPTGIGIYRGNQNWEYLNEVTHPSGGVVESFAVVNMTINNVKKDFLFAQVGNTVYYWDGLTYTIFNFVGQTEFVTAYKSGIAVCGTFTSVDGNPVSGVAYWNGIVWRQIGALPFLEGKAILEHNNQLYISGNFNSNPEGDPLERIAVFSVGNDKFQPAFKTPPDSVLRAQFQTNHALFTIPNNVKLK